MANLGKALKGFSQGFGLGLQLDQEKRELKLIEEEAKRKGAQDLLQKQINLVKERVAEKQAEAALTKIQNERLKGATDFVNSFFAGREDITPNEMKAGVKLLKDQHGFDAEPYFKSNSDDAGVIKNYSFDTADSLQKEVENKINQDNAATAKINAVAAKINAEAGKIKAEKGSFKDAIGWYVNTQKNLTPEKVKKFVNDLESAKAMDQGFELETNPDGSLKSIKFGGTSKKVTKGDSLTPTTRAESEKKLAAFSAEMFALKEVKDSYIQDLFTYKGRIKSWTLDKVAKINPKLIKEEDKEWMGRMWVFQANLGRFFDEYRLRVTKSQAAIKELNMLQKRVQSADMSDPVFLHSLDDSFERIRRQMRIERLLINEGLYGNEYWEKFNAMVGSSGDPTLTKENIDSRGDGLAELFKENRPKSSIEEIEKFVVDQLKEEGYIK